MPLRIKICDHVGSSSSRPMTDPSFPRLLCTFNHIFRVIQEESFITALLVNLYQLPSKFVVTVKDQGTPEFFFEVVVDKGVTTERQLSSCFADWPETALVFERNHGQRRDVDGAPSMPHPEMQKVRQQRDFEDVFPHATGEEAVPIFPESRYHQYYGCVRSIFR